MSFHRNNPKILLLLVAEMRQPMSPPLSLSLANVADGFVGVSF